jgi:hypothetical protein
VHIIIISLNVTCSCNDIAEQLIACLVLNNNHSLNLLLYTWLNSCEDLNKSRSKNTTYDNGDPDPGFGKVHKCQWNPNSLHLNNWILNGNTDTCSQTCQWNPNPIHLNNWILNGNTDTCSQTCQWNPNPLHLNNWILNGNTDTCS